MLTDMKGTFSPNVNYTVIFLYPDGYFSEKSEIVGEFSSPALKM